MAAKMSAYEYYDSLDNMTELAKYDGNARRGTINNPWVIRDWEDLQNTYKDTKLGVYSSEYQAHFILVNDIDFAKLNFGAISTHDGGGYTGDYRGCIECCDSFDFNGYEFRNIIYRNITSINGFYQDALIEINNRHDNTDIIMKNVKITNIIINECYLNASISAVSDTIYSYQEDCLAIFKFSTYRNNVVIDGLNLNISISQQNQITSPLMLYNNSTDTDLVHANKLQLFSIASTYSGSIKFKNTFIKFSGISKHWFGVGSGSYRDSTDVDSICCLPAGCLHGMATMHSAKSEDAKNKFKNMYDTTLFFNDYIIDVLTNPSNYSCYTLLTPAIPTDSLYITGSIKIKYSALTYGDSNTSYLYICGNPHSNVIFDCELSYIGGSTSSRFKITNEARYGKVIINKDKIPGDMLNTNFSNSNGGIIFATTEQLKDETWLRENGLFFLKTSS